MGCAGSVRRAVERGTRAVIGHRQRGVALISILLIVALVTALMYHLMTRQALVVAQTRQVIRADQSLAYALGAEAYARQILYDDWNRPTGRAIDTLSEAWAVPSVPFDIEVGTLELSIEDLDRRFNLNSLAGQAAPKNIQRLKSLLSALGMDPVAAEAWRDWVDQTGSFIRTPPLYFSIVPPMGEARYQDGIPIAIQEAGLSLSLRSPSMGPAHSRRCLSLGARPI